MKPKKVKYNVTWEEKISYSTTILAENEEEAEEIFMQNNHKENMNDVEFIEDSLEINELD